MKVTTSEFNGKKSTIVQVTRMDAKGKILDITDAVNYNKVDEGFEVFEKVQLNTTEYGEGKESIALKHYMDLDDFLLMAQKIAFGSKVDIKDFKGNKSDKYPTGYEARTLTVRLWSEADGCKMPGGAYTFEFVNGAGVAGDKGQVSLSPAHSSTQKKVKFNVQAAECSTKMLYAYNYFICKQTAFLSLNWKELFSR